jgi:tetratricopeptide (TPR) repeat protein
VTHVCTPLLQALAPALSRALKLPAGEELTTARLKPHLMLFVDCKVDNPEFDSQSKEALTSHPSSFGGLCALPDAFIKRVAALEGLVADHPDFSLAHSALAAWCTRLERHDDAVRHARRVCELEPADPFSYTALSVACMRAGRIAEAEEALAKSRLIQAAPGR